MSVPVAVLLGFALWTLLVLFLTVGIYRWTRILARGAQLTEFPADQPHGEDWYRRAMRAHANCVENLPVYGAIAVAIVATGVSSRALDVLAVVFLAARVCQTLVHVGFRQSNAAIAVRFGFFLTQAGCMLAMAGVLVSEL